MKTYACIIAAKVANKVRSRDPLVGLSGYDAVVEIADGQKVEVGDDWNGTTFARAPKEPRVLNRETMTAALTQGLVDIQTYIDLPAPNATQRLNFERMLGRNVKRLIRLQLDLLDAAD